MWYYLGMQPLLRIPDFFPGYDFLVEGGEFIAIFGSHDLEKNLLLRFLGLLEGDFNDFFLCGQNLDALPDHELLALRQSEIGLYFSNLELLSSHTIIENVALPLRLAGIGKTESLERASATLEAFGLRSREYFFPHQLSEIQKHRTCLARAIVNDPRLLLAENPTFNLSLKSKTIILNDLKRISLGGITIILSTQDDYLSPHVSRIIKIENSQIIYDTPTNQQKDMPTFTTAAPRIIGKKPLGAK
jgi:ABC-type lipoprotein export system ATPase subunit